MWPNFRCKKAERERDLADEANRLFKQEFGDKIASLQQEVEQLRRQRYWEYALFQWLISRKQKIWFVVNWFITHHELILNNNGNLYIYSTVQEFCVSQIQKY